jgi:hypothetical protein
VPQASRAARRGPPRMLASHDAYRRVSRSSALIAAALVDQATPARIFWRSPMNARSVRRGEHAAQPITALHCVSAGRTAEAAWSCLERTTPPPSCGGEQIHPPG